MSKQPPPKRLIAVAPGRGSYSQHTLNSLSQRPWSQASLNLLAQADQLRQAAGLPTISELDHAQKFSAPKHQKGENASALIYTLSCMDFCELQQTEHKIIAVTGNSLGWYTTLYTSGALSFLDGLKIVEALGQRQKNQILGRQILVPVSNDQWQLDPKLESSLKATMKSVMAQSPAEHLQISIDLGGMLVLAGTQKGLDEFSKRFKKVKRKGLDYPLPLPFHSAFHTPLMAQASEFALSHFAKQKLNWQNLKRTAIDGRGFRWGTFGASDPQALSNYTFGHQITKAYNFRRAIQSSLLEFQPDHLVLLGPGDNLGSSLGQIMIACHWHSLHSKADFLKLQKTTSRPLVSMAREDQRTELLKRR